VRGCPALLLDGGHPARDIQRFVDGFDLTGLEQQYSSLGRHGHHPKRVLAVWLYASQLGLHHATKAARACATDAALLFLSGGHPISAGTLKRFRQKNRSLFEALLAETVRLAHVDGLIIAEELATDSMRLRAHASIHQVGTAKRSQKRLAEIEAVDRTQLSEKQHKKLDDKLTKHRAVIAACEARDSTSAVLTNPQAALMKFPNGAGLPGHRITATAAGVSERIVVGVLVDAAPADDGKLGPALQRARDVLVEAGVPIEGMQVAADAGYFCVTDLEFASTNRDWVDVLIAEGSTGVEPVVQGRKGFFDRSRFKILDDGTAVCPAERLMTPPRLMSDGRTTWIGVGCQRCSLRPQCTSRTRRALTADLNLEKVRTEMRRRLAEPGARERYGQRIATIEPVFANIEDVMGYRRASSRHPTTIVSEVLLKVVAHNLARIVAARKLACVSVPLELG
jgi:tellurite resistance protein